MAVTHRFNDAMRLSVRVQMTHSAFALMGGRVSLSGHGASLRTNEALDALDMNQTAAADADALYPALLDVFVERDATDTDRLCCVIDTARDGLHCFVSIGPWRNAIERCGQDDAATAPRRMLGFLVEKQGKTFGLNLFERLHNKLRPLPPLDLGGRLTIM